MQTERLRRGTLGYDVTVLETSNEGRLTRARFNFRTKLEHPSFVFADWDGEDFRRVEFPPR